MPQIPRGRAGGGLARGRRAAGASDLGARVLTAIPAAIVGVVLVWQGGLCSRPAWRCSALVCLHELYAMFDRAQPVRLAGFLALLGMVVAAHYGDSFAVLRRCAGGCRDVRAAVARPRARRRSGRSR